MKKILDCCTILGVPLALFIVYAGLNYSGFCFAEMRYLSDEDKFRELFERVNQQDNIFINGLPNYERIKYESFEQFMQINPDCCAIDPPGGGYDIAPSTFKERITGIHSGEVTVMNYTVYYLDENGKRRSKESKIEMIQQNCGRRRYD